MEHLRHFGLTRDAFVNDPLVSLYFASGAHANAERRLSRAVSQAKGLCVLTGAEGTGKTMIVRHLLDALEEEVYEACLLVPMAGVSDGDWVLTRFARQLGVEEPAADRSELLGQIYERLAIVREDGRNTVLIVDEAQVLIENEALRELRGLLNLEYEDRRLVTLVLVGLPSLERAIADEPALASRVDIKCRIDPMDPEGAIQYVHHRLRCVEGNPGIFESGALAALIELGGGAPRRLNTLADNALFEAYVAGRKAVTPEDVRRAAADLAFDVPETPATPAKAQAAPPQAVQAVQAAPASVPRPAAQATPVTAGVQGAGAFRLPPGHDPGDSLAFALDIFEAPRRSGATSLLDSDLFGPEPVRAAVAPGTAPAPAEAAVGSAPRRAAAAAPAAPAPAPAAAVAAAPAAAPARSAPAPESLEDSASGQPRRTVIGAMRTPLQRVRRAPPAADADETAVLSRPLVDESPSAASPAFSDDGLVGLDDFHDVRGRPTAAKPPARSQAPAARVAPPAAAPTPQQPASPPRPQARPAGPPAAPPRAVAPAAPPALPVEGPPKEDADLDDIFVDLIDDL